MPKSKIKRVKNLTTLIGYEGVSINTTLVEFDLIIIDANSNKFDLSIQVSNQNKPDFIVKSDLWNVSKKDLQALAQAVAALARDCLF